MYPLALVRVTGLEPAHRLTPEPKSGASANSATPACVIFCVIFYVFANARLQYGSRRYASSRLKYSRPDYTLKCLSLLVISDSTTLPVSATGSGRFVTNSATPACYFTLFLHGE